LIDSIDAPIEGALVASVLALRDGEAASAIALAERWLHSDSDSQPLHAGGRGASIEVAFAHSLLVQANLELGKLDAAASAAALLQELASLGSGAVFLAAMAALSQGRVATAFAQTEVGIRYFEVALNCFAKVELPLEAARTRIDLARALAAEQRALAISEARTALAVFDRLGASTDADIAAALLRSWGSTGRSVPRNSGALTRREHEILGLLVEGLSNQEIAASLYISHRTAAHHVSKILAKLGVRNRAEAAVYAARFRP
jgi:DNA-binding CsgD family transcriptional regulator